MRFLINGSGYIYPYTDMLAKRKDMKEISEAEVKKKQMPDDVKQSDEKQALTDDEVIAWAKEKGIDNDKQSIADYGLTQFDTKINKSMTPVNMVRELIKLSNESE